MDAKQDLPEPHEEPASSVPGEISQLAEIDRLVHEPARLMLLALLCVVESADFTFIMNQTGLSWGNLSAHMSKLEEAQYIEVVKTFKDRRPNTQLRLTPKGRSAFREYRQKMKTILDDLNE
jgi:DNA-binding MarR family transcriptional regulator